MKSLLFIKPATILLSALLCTMSMVFSPGSTPNPATSTAASSVRSQGKVPPQNSVAWTGNMMWQPPQWTHNSLWVPKGGRTISPQSMWFEDSCYITSYERNCPGKSDPSQLLASGPRTAAQTKWEGEWHPVPLHAAPGPEPRACDVTHLTVPTGQPQLALYGKAETKNKQTENHSDERFCFPGRELTCSS